MLPVRKYKVDAILEMIPPVFIQFFIYASIGVIGAVLDIGLFTILYKILGIFYLLAFFIGKTVGIVNNFFLNARFNFKTSDRMLQRFVSFYCIGLIGVGVGSLLMYLLVARLGFDAVIMNIIVTFCLAVIQFLVNRVISFKK